jgi:hypothetical protein
MFCIVFMFSCVLQVLEKNPSNFKIITKSANSLLERFNSKSILNLRKDKSPKIRYFWKESRMSMSLYFNHNFFFSRIGLQQYWWHWKYKTKCNKSVRNRFFLIWTFIMPKLPRNKGPQISTKLESFSYLD